MPIQKVEARDLETEKANHLTRVHVVQDLRAFSYKQYLGTFQNITEDENTELNEVEIDGDLGPRKLKTDGTWFYHKGWKNLSATEKKVVLDQVARRNRGMRGMMENNWKQEAEKYRQEELRVDFRKLDEEMKHEREGTLKQVLGNLQSMGTSPELTLDVARDLQSSLLESFRNPDFQKRLRAIEFDNASAPTRLSKERQELIYGVYRTVLPMYGFEQTGKGIYDMKQAFNLSPWASQEDILQNKAKINQLLYGSGGVEEKPDDREQPSEEDEPEEASLGYSEAEQRCLNEWAKPTPPFMKITFEQLAANCEKKAPGIYYGLEFPWSAELLEEMGPAWLTKAFKAAGTMPEDNAVTKITNVVGFVKGGAGSKFVFDVQYRRTSPRMHTRLFAKIPFPFGGATRSDRMAMSVNQQGQEVQEICLYRLLESRLPFRIPRYYFGDISLQTTNFILITERVPYGEKEGGKQFEPSYSKMMDWELVGKPEEYYYALVQAGARLAAFYKNGKLAPTEMLDKLFGNHTLREPAHWGMGPHSTGLKDNEFKMKIAMGADFVQTHGAKLFPAECTTDEFIEKYKRLLTKANAYTCEAQWWSSRNRDYTAWTHINLNVDNSFFWRDAKGRLGLGILDWGGVTCDALGSKLWWWLYCCEYEYLTEHIDGMLQCFVDTFQKECGIELSKQELRLHFILAALQQGIGVLGAVPMIYRMCPKKEWKTIESRRDPRICGNIGGTGNLRVYIGTFVNIVRMIKDWGVVEAVDGWIEKFTEMSGMPEKKIELPPSR